VSTWSAEAQSAEQILREAAQLVTDERAATARQRAHELFLAAPWLAADIDGRVPGCINLRFGDLYALLVLADAPSLAEKE
jgi:3-mercaptopyruvate sulfurtransferase SseA